MQIGNNYYINNNYYTKNEEKESKGETIIDISIQNDHQQKIQIKINKNMDESLKMQLTEHILESILSNNCSKKDQKLTIIDDDQDGNINIQYVANKKKENVQKNKKKENMVSNKSN